MKKRAALYVRVSTLEQANEGYSIQAQTEKLVNYAKAMDYEVVETYVDPGHSGAKLDRPGLNSMLADIDKKLIDMVIVYKLDRLSRSQKNTLYLIEDVFIKNNVEFFSLQESFDTSTPFGRAMIGILAVFAQLERDTITERMQMGLRERGKLGLWHGGGFDPLGYDYIDGKLVVNHEEAAVVKQVYSLFIQGFPIYKIRRTIKETFPNTKYGAMNSDTTLNNILTQPLYIGKIKSYGEMYNGIHEPIILEEVFNKAQIIMDSRKQKSSAKIYNFKNVNVLSGLIYCEFCGAAYTVKGNHSGHGEKRRYYPYYTCHSRAKIKKNKILDPECKNKSFAVEKLDQLIINKIKQISFEEILLGKNSNSSSTPDKKVSLNKKLLNIEKQIGKLIDLYQISSLDIDQLNKRIDKLNTDKLNIEKEFSELDSNKSNLSITDAQKLVNDLTTIETTDDKQSVKSILMQLIDKIIITEDEKIEVHWAFA